jgi:hypothetical protein
MSATTEFRAGIGRWSGSADVFDGAGHFVGGGADTRHVQPLDGGRVRIDVSFVGPFRHAGHYVIHDHGSHRIYDGPANVGYAETLSDSLVDANAFWPTLGLSQRFFLMVLPDGKTQLSLAMMSRGEHQLYVVVGQNILVTDQAPQPTFISGTAHDLGQDPTCGRGEILLNRAGTWRGQLTVLDGYCAPLAQTEATETIIPTERGVQITRMGGMSNLSTVSLISDGWHAWTPYDEPTQEVVGSASIYGGRAMSGQFHHRTGQMRVWRRQVITHDGAQKAVLNVWYAGGRRIGVEYGVLEFEPA